MADLFDGDIVVTKSLQSHVQNDIVTGTVTYRAGKGRAFVVLLLGATDLAGEPFDPIAALNALGWERPALTSPLTVAGWQRTAFDDTVTLAQSRGMVGEGSLSLAHLVDMQSRLTPDMSPSKVGRWLGWAQAAVCASGVATLDDFKQLNMRCSANEPTPPASQTP